MANVCIPPQILDDRVTPNALEVLLHYHGSGVPHPRHDAPAVADARNSFLQLDVIEPVHIVNSQVLPGARDDQPGLFRTTDRGNAWVEALCQVRIPSKYEIP